MLFLALTGHPVTLEQASELAPLLGAVALSFALGAWTVRRGELKRGTTFFFWALGVVVSFVFGPTMSWALFLIVTLLRPS